MYNCINIARIDLKRVFNCGKKHNAFSMAEMLVVMLILAIVIISMTPVAVKRVKKESVNPEHGSYECFYEPSGEAGIYNLKQRVRNEAGVIVDGDGDDAIVAKYNVNENPLPPPPSCRFVPPRGAMFFTVNAVGGGSPGTGSKDAFSGLPEGAKHSIGSKSYAGVNYINGFSQYKSIILDTSHDNTLSIEGKTFGSINTNNSPARLLNTNGMDLYVFLRSEGGILDDSTGAGYVVKKINDEYCPENPDWSKLEYQGDARWTYKACIPGKEKKNWAGKITGCYEYYPGDCVVVNAFTGKNPASGSATKFTMNIKNGSSIVSNDGDAPAFAAGSYGCKVGLGDNGCYDSQCSPASGKITNYSSSQTCPSTYRTLGGGAPSKFKTITSISSSGTINCEYHYSDYCVPDGSGGFTTGKESCSPNYTIIQQSGDGVGWHLYTMGNFMLVRKKLSKGVNFYAPAGNPGEFRTMYVSRFTKGVVITPGAPKQSTNTNNSETGNDTLMVYSDGVQLLRVPGGKRAVATSEALENTFIIGNLFNLPLPATPYVIAYDTDSGDNSGRVDEYGNFFKERKSSFIYPIPDIKTAIPESVGQGGHGSYTIFRSTGNSEGYRVWKIKKDKSVSASETLTGKSYTWVQSLLDTSGDSGATRTNEAYTCVSNHKTLSGDNPRPTENNNSYRCYAGDGQGGAVVITW